MARAWSVFWYDKRIEPFGVLYRDYWSWYHWFVNIHELLSLRYGYFIVLDSLLPELQKLLELQPYLQPDPLVVSLLLASVDN